MQTTSSLSNNNDKGCKRIDTLFSKFAAFYGHIWRSQFKHETFMDFAKKEWQEGLKAFSDKVLEQVTLECRDGCELPPTLPQMIKFCRDVKRRTSVEEKERYTPARLEVFQKHLRQCKALLK